MKSDLFLEDFPDDILINVSVEQIIPNPKQPRKFFSDKSLSELAQSIRVKGVLQPLIVRTHPFKNNCYELVAGERRWRALQKLEVFQVPVVLRKIKDDELLEISLLENIQREDLTIIEEAQSYQDLLKTHGYTQEELAKKQVNPTIFERLERQAKKDAEAAPAEEAKADAPAEEEKKE